MRLGAAAELAAIVGISGLVLHGMDSKKFQEPYIATSFTWRRQNTC